MSLETPENIRKFQRKLYRKAKREPDFRFYSLYDKVYRKDILRHAYRLVKEEKGGPGVDEETFDDIEEQGVSDWLESLREDLKEGRYKPKPLKRVEIEKDTGGKRPLSIPTVQDRVAQMAAKLVLEPIFEADLSDQVYGYRPNRSCLDAVKKVHTELCDGHLHVVDADVSGYFDNIPHDQLLKSVANRVSDGSILGLIKSWLKVAIREEDDNGNVTFSGGKSSTKGTPQGGVISPLLANIYINRLLKAWNGYSKPEKFHAHLVNYADDFVVLCRTKGGARKSLEWIKSAMETMGLTLNREKTEICNANIDDFDFLGYTFGRRYSKFTGRQYLAATPSDASVKSLKERVKRILKTSQASKWEEVLEELNYLLTGWTNYYSYGSLSGIYRAVNYYVYDAVVRFLSKRQKLSTRNTRNFPADRVFGELGVYKLAKESWSQ